MNLIHSDNIQIHFFVTGFSVRTFYPYVIIQKKKKSTVVEGYLKRI